MTLILFISILPPNSTALLNKGGTCSEHLVVRPAPVGPICDGRQRWVSLHLGWSWEELALGTWKVTSLAGKKPELVSKVKRFRLDVFGLASMHSLNVQALPYIYPGGAWSRAGASLHHEETREAAWMPPRQLSGVWGLLVTSNPWTRPQGRHAWWTMSLTWPGIASGRRKTGPLCLGSSYWTLDKQ